MCEPTTIIMLAAAAASALATKSASDNMAHQQAVTANNQTAEAYRVAQENDRSLQAQAFEQQTDRMRKASRELAEARVIAAEGGGSLAARAINITAGAAEDYSRIDIGLREQRSSIRGQVAAAGTQNIDAMNMAQTQFKANQIQLGANLVQAGAGAATSYYGRQTELELARNKRTYLGKP